MPSSEQSRGVDRAGGPTSAAPFASLVATPRRAYWVAFAVLATLMGLWAVANPPMAAPDEPAHVIKAAAVVRGQLTGVSDPGGPGSAFVEVPALYAYSLTVPQCWVNQPNIPATCSPPEPADLDATTQASTWVVRNNPLYYAVVGLPTLLPASGLTFYLMRLMSALLTAGILAWAFRELATLPERRSVGLGLLSAITPMVLFLGSTVNSSALEVSAALALWTSMLTLLTAPDPARLRVRMAGIGVLAVLLTNSRGLAPVFFVVIVLTTIAISPWRNTLAVLRDRRSWPWIAVAGAGLAAALVWTASAGTLESGGTSSTGVSVRAGLRAAIAQTPAYIAGMIGHFGWLDVNLPQWLYLWFALAIGVTLILSVLVARRRADLLAVAAVALLGLVLPVLIQAWQAKNVGVIWQGRYSLPLVVGLPLVSAFVVQRSLAGHPTLKERPIFVVTASMLAFGQVLAFAVNLHRYVRGAGASWFGSSPADWAPVVPSVVLVVAYALASTALVLVVGAVARAAETDGDAPVVQHSGSVPAAAGAGS